MPEHHITCSRHREAATVPPDSERAGLPPLHEEREHDVLCCCGDHLRPTGLAKSLPSEPGVHVTIVRDGDPWPEAVSDGLVLACSVCGEVPRFDYSVESDFWRRLTTPDERAAVVCLPCLDRRCGGVGLGEALLAVQWTGTGHTVVLIPDRVICYEPPPAPAAGGVGELDTCQAQKDGDCDDPRCPQLRDGEPEHSGRSCPLLSPEDER